MNDLAGGRSLPAELAARGEQLSRQYQFFHWHLAFPEVFAKGGFDCVLGNPPWERVKLQEKEWFAERSPEIANAPNAAARKRLIEALKAGDPAFINSFSTTRGRPRAKATFCGTAAAIRSAVVAILTSTPYSLKACVRC